MEIRKYLLLLDTFEALKRNTRHSWTSDGRHESVAEHSWRLTIMAYFIRDEFPEADINKVILMCLCHDLGEAFTGDIPSFLKTEADETKEQKMLDKFTSQLPEPYSPELTALFAEMAELKTLESRLYKALDKLEAVIQHNEADISTWLPLEYQTNLTYANENVEFSKYLSDLRAEIYNDTIIKINNSKLKN